jgi:outer membrane protein assembly factor BamE (lipoprotein component of BamABCDE complex)
MNTKSLLPLVTTLALACTFAACGGGGDQPKTASASTRKSDSEDHQDSDASSKKPRIGMTQRQVREIYGDPSNVSQTGDGEVWTYWFNKGHAFIPYNFGYRAKTGTFFFNSSGVLKNYSMNE